MSRRLVIFLLFFSASLLLGVFLLWAGAKPLTDRVLRPWIAEKIGDAASAEADLGKLEIHHGQIVLIDLSVKIPGELQFRVPKIEIGFSWFDLLFRRLNKIDIRSPELQWEKPPGGDNGKTPARVRMDETAAPIGPPPLQVEEVTVRDGDVTVVLGEHRLEIRSINARGGIGPRFDVRLDALVGSDAGVPVGLTGNGTWIERPEFTIDNLTWGGEQLLENPVTISPDLHALDTTISLDRFDQGRATRLFTAFGVEPPWPDGLRWEVSSPSASLKVKGGEMSGLFTAGAGSLGGETGKVSWENLRIGVEHTGEKWTIDGKIGLPGATGVMVAGDLTDGGFQGVGRILVPDPPGLAANFGGPDFEMLKMFTDFHLAGAISGTREEIIFESRALKANISGKGQLGGALSVRIDKGVLTAELTGLELLQGGESNPLASGEATVRKSLENNGPWTGKWAVRASSVKGLAARFAIDVPDQAPDLRHLEVRGRLTAGEDGVVLPGVECQFRLVGPEAQGEVKCRLAVRLKDAWQVDLAELTIEDVDYFSQDGIYGLGGGSFRAAGEIREEGPKIAATLVGKLAAREGLAGKWYGLLEGLPLEFSLAAAWEEEENRFEVSRLDLDWADIASVRLSGRIAPSIREIRGELDIPRLQGRFIETVRSLSADILPAAQSVDLSGRLGMNGSFVFSAEGWDATLNLRPENLDFTFGEDVRIAGLTGGLPLLFAGGKEVRAEQDRPGHLSWTSLSTQLSDGGPGRLDVAMEPNRVRLRQPVSLMVAGGVATLQSFQLGWNGESPDLKASARVEGISLVRLSEAIGWPTMAGELTADLEDIRYADDRIFTGGEVTAQVFHGNVVMRNLQVRKPFSRYPTYHADIDFSGIDLQLLTHAIEFGEVNGIADGYVHDLRLFDGVPSAFEAKFETRNEGTRNISVKAINNLNTLSQGGMSAALSQGIYQFIDFYRYRKIGVRCWLANDVFRLEGTAREGSDDYLIYGSLLPPRIDVIVSSKTISFKEMVKRLQRIERTGG